MQEGEFQEDLQHSELCDSRVSATGWPIWQQPKEADILKLVRILTPLVKFLHPAIVAAVVEDNQRHFSDWRLKLEEVDVDSNIYLWNESPCAFPGVRRHAGKEERNSFKDRTKNFPHCLWLDDNDYPKHLWSFVFTGGSFRKEGPPEYQLAHLADHKEHNNRCRDEFSIGPQDNPPRLYGLFTSPANTVFVPNDFLRPTDFSKPLRALLLKRAYQLYGKICTLAPPPLTEKALDDSAWNPDDFNWGEPVGDAHNVALFLEYRRKKFNEGIRCRRENALAKR